MLSMAIEGVRQLFSSSDETITGFNICDVHFLTALQVPPTSPGIETQVSLTKQNTNSPDMKPWYKFRLFTYTSSWLEHCHGSIRPQTEGHEPSAAPYTSELLSTSRACTKDAQIRRVYDSIRTNGVNYGPIFQTLSDVRIGKNGAAVAHVRPFSDDPQTIESANVDFKPYVMHPSVLDGLFQMVFPALNEGGKRDLPAMVPSYVKRLFISAEASSSGYLQASNRSELNSFRGTLSTVVAMSASGDALLSYMDGYETTFVSQTGGPESSDYKDRHLLSYVKWQPDVTLMDNKQLAQLCAREAPKMDAASTSFNGCLPLLTRQYVHKIQEPIQPSWPNGISKELLGYTTHEAHLEDNEKAITQANIEAEIEDARKTDNFYVAREKQRLQFIQQGAKAPFPEDQGFVEVSKEYLNERLTSEHLVKPLAAFLTALAHKNPLMKILDIGAGWQDTLPCIDILSKNCQAPWAQYDCTERSQEDLKKAEQRLSSLSHRIQFRVLDVDGDAVEQGFEEASYDLVVATSVGSS